MPTTDADTSFTDRVARAAEDVRAARARYHADQEEAWDRYTTAVEEALTEDLGLEDVTGEDAEVPGPVADLLTAVRSRLDDLNLQVHLGRMEADDLAEAIRAAVDSAIARMRR